MTAREIEAILSRAGFVLTRQTGHRIWEKDQLAVPVPVHRGDVPKGTIRNIIKLAEMTVEEFLGYR